MADSEPSVREQLSEFNCMTETDAVEFFHFNQIGAWMGENTPVFVRTIQKTSS